MIIPFKPQEHGQEEFLVCSHATTTVAELRERMLQRAKVTQGSYAYRLIEDLHSAIFVQSLDLKSDYEAYFAREYASFGEFLQRRTHLPAAVVHQVAATVGTTGGVYYVKRSFDFLSDASGFEILTRLLEELPYGEAS